MNLRDEYEAACRDYEPDPDERFGFDPSDVEMPRKRRTYSCGDRTCGATDCVSCYPCGPQPGEEDEEGEE